MKKTCFLLPLLMGFMATSSAFAQGGIGASYERRNAEPKEGLGIRIEKTFGTSSEMVNAGILGHVSFFSNSITLEKNDTGSGATFERTDLSTFDFGLAGKIAVNVPFVTPYVMAGLGFENYNIEVNESFNGVDFKNDERTLMVNGTIGVQLRVLDAIRPFAEIRYSKNFDDYEFETTFDNLKAAKNRVAFGVSLQF